MPVTMNFDFMTNRAHVEKCDALTGCQSTLELKLSKSPLSNGTNRPTVPSRSPIVKPRVHGTVTTLSSSRTNRKINLKALASCSSSTQIPLPDEETSSWAALASSTEHILVGGGSSSQLRLYDFQGKQIRSIDIHTFAAFDLAWSTVLNAFLIAGYDRLQMYNVEKNRLTEVDDFHLVNKKYNYFWSIACHETDLFVVLSDGLEPVWRVSLPDFKRVQTLSGSEIRESNLDDRISCIRTNGLSVAMTLRQRQTQQWRVDLFDYTTMVRTHRGLTIGYGIGAFNFQERVMLTCVDDHQWLIIGGDQFRPNAITLMDDRTGEIKQILRSDEDTEEFLGNICASDYRKSPIQTIILLKINNKTNQRQIHVWQQQG